MNSISTLTSNHSRLGAVRNPQGIFINTEVFREEGSHFMKNGYYTPDPENSPGWIEYWEEQTRRCIEGYEVGGVKITGDHYGYLNFAPIQKIERKNFGRVAPKITGFPDFWDGDYNYFHSLDIAFKGISLENLKKLQLSVNPHLEYLSGGYHMLVGKARRKGYSYKNGWVCANTYNTVPNSLCVIGAFDKSYLYGKGKGTMVMASNYINFFNEHTGWGKKRDYVDKIDAKRASYKSYNPEGMPVESGYMSEIVAITFKDNPDAAKGKDAFKVLLEEGGAFPNLKDSWKATAPGLTAGKYITGQMIGFGTGGDMASGTLEFSEMFYSPELYGVMPFMNIWDEDGEESTCSFFHPMHWNREGYYDAQGNSDSIRALSDEKIERELLLKKSSGTGILEGRMQEYPTCPAEAFLTVSHNDFPVVELRNRLNRVIREELYLKKGQPVELYKDEFGKVKAKPDLDNKLNPIWFRKPKTTDLTGAVIIYEYPIENAPKGLYKIGYDPYEQDLGTSLGSITVYKGSHKHSFTRDSIVAEYTGRPKDADEMNRIFEYLIELYNTEGMYENEVSHVKGYFARRKKLHLLAGQPDQVISNAIKNSGVARVYGCHMNDKLKDTGEKYIKSWLLEVRDYDENGKEITNIDLINSPGFLEELIAYHRKGNFDRVSSFIMVMIQVQEEELGKEYGDEDVETPLHTLVNMIDKMYRKN